jgi:signal peptidase I
MSEAHRGAAARIGIAALNILLPGLGLMRTGHLRAAAAFMALALGALALILLGFAFLPRLTFAGWAALVGAAAAIHLAALVGSAVLSWRRSAVGASTRWWSHWYVLAGAWLAYVASNFLLPDPADHYRTFYVASESMAPTLVRNARFVAQMSRIGPLRRGDIVLVRTESGAIYISRIAALGGDRIGMAQGRILLNGAPVPQRFVAAEAAAFDAAQGPVRRLAERMPGEEGEHHVYDAGTTPFDDFETVIVRPGHVFLLGDNRDHAADSRLPRDAAGLEQVPVADVVGRALFFIWGPGSSQMGAPIAH